MSTKTATEVVVGGGNVSPGQMMEFWRQVAAGIINRNRMQLILDHQAFDPKNVSFDWERVYMEIGRRAQFEKQALLMMDGPKSEKWDIIVLEGVTLEDVDSVLRKLDMRIRYEVLNTTKIAMQNERKADKTYKITCAKSLKGDLPLTANEIQAQCIKSMTLLERMLLELAYYITTGDSLDKESLTLCTGSSFPSDSIPMIGYQKSLGGLYIADYPDRVSRYVSWSGQQIELLARRVELCQ